MPDELLTDAEINDIVAEVFAGDAEALGQLPDLAALAKAAKEYAERQQKIMAIIAAALGVGVGTYVLHTLSRG